MESKIEFIEVSKLMPHPDNPRFAVGDVTELANSLKAKGCLQNLTIVKSNNGETYLVVIGHRRLAAAKLAGIKELPCVISDMTRQEQIETMVLENMQREDLTLYEQACGIQMMIEEFGATVSDISEKTGLSETTIYRRRKLAELDNEVMAELDQKVKAGERQITLDDYLSLCEINDEQARTKLLKDIGTDNFRYGFNNEKQRQKQAEALATIVSRLEAAGWKKGGCADARRYIGWIGASDPDAPLPELPEGAQGYYLQSTSTYFNLYRTYTEDEKTQEAKVVSPYSAAEAKREQLNERRDRLKEASLTAFRCRMEFIKNFNPAVIFSKNIMLFALRVLLNNYEIDCDIMCELCGIEFDWENESFYDDVVPQIMDKAADKPLLYLLYAAYALCEDGSLSYWNYDCSYRRNDDLDKLYKDMCKLGYGMSEAERQLQDGSHELFEDNNDE